MPLCRLAVVKRLPVHQFSVVIFTFAGPLGLGFTVALNLWLGGVRNVPSAITEN